MSHNIKYREYLETTSTTIIEKEINDYVRHATWEEGSSGLVNPIRFINKVFSDYGDAEEYIKEHDKGWYDSLAVKYKELPHGTTSKKLEDLKKREQTAQSEYYTFERVVFAKDFKAEFVGCQHCGSKISRKHIKTNYCPVCHGDMRSETTLNKLKNMKAKVEKLHEEVIAEENKLKEKSSKIYWLVKFEYHT